MNKHKNKIIAGVTAALVLIAGGVAWADHQQEQERQEQVDRLTDAILSTYGL